MNNDIDSRDENKQTPLMHAVYKNDAEMVKSLLQQGANSLLKDNKYCSVLMYAVKYADPQIVQYISDDIKYRIGIEQKRTDGPKKKHRIRDVINVYDIYGKNALIYAIMRGNLEIVKILLSFHGIWVNIYDERNGLTPLMYAILQLETRNPRDYNEYIKIIYLLLQHGAHVNEKDKNYKSVLMYACQYGDADLVKEILARMNDGVILKKDNKNAAILNIINNTDSQKNYALMCAVRHGNVDIVKLLLGYDIRINIVDKNGLTPIMYALESGNDEMVNLLLDAGVDLWRCDYDEHDVFYYIENSLLELPEPTISRIKKLYNTFTTQLEIALAYIKSNDVTALENWCGVYKGLINREINGKTLLMHATEMKKNTMCGCVNQTSWWAK